jgi:hypothetical protein
MKGRKGRASWAIYSWPSMEEGLGFLARGTRSTARRKTCSGEAPARGGRQPQPVGHPCWCLAWRRPVLFRYGDLGLWAGQIGPQRPFTLFLFSFHFLYSDFWIVSNLLQMWFKSIQTNL